MSQTTVGIVAALMLVLTGCGRTLAPKGGMLIYHKELPAADRAVEDARRAGKAAQCPAEFREAEALRDQAYLVYWSCRTNEAIGLANQAVAKANALCPVKVAPAPPPPPPPVPAPPPPPPAPTATISANPASVQTGACSTLTWSSTNASSASIDPGVGNVPTSGSRQVCPTSTTNYTIVASGAGGSARASTSVTVTAPPPPPAPKVIDKLIIHVNFDFDKYVVRPADVAELQKAVDFLKKYPNANISIEGHTDSIGTVEYNLRLSERRANAVRDWLIARGATDAAHAKTVGHGKANPIATNSTPEGRFQNRRVEILILSQ